MTREDLVDWIKVHKCEQSPIDGLNNTAWQIKFTNSATKGYAYLNTPIDDTIVLDHIICHICVLLGIPIPTEAKHQEGLVNHLKEKFGKKY